MVTWPGIPIGDMEYQCTTRGYNQPQISCCEEYNSEIGYLSCYFCWITNDAQMRHRRICVSCRDEMETLINIRINS